MDRLSNMAITGAMATILVLVASAILLPYAVSRSTVKWNGAIEKQEKVLPDSSIVYDTELVKMTNEIVSMATEIATNGIPFSEGVRRAVR